MSTLACWQMLIAFTRLLCCIKHLLPSFHSRHGLHVFPPVTDLHRLSYKHKRRRELCHNTGASNLKSFISAHLLGVFLLDGLEVCSQVHGHLVFGAQQRAQDGVSGDSDSPQGGSLEFASQVQDFDGQVFDLSQVCLKVSLYWALWFLCECDIMFLYNTTVLSDWHYSVILE